MFSYQKYIHDILLTEMKASLSETGKHEWNFHHMSVEASHSFGHSSLSLALMQGIHMWYRSEMNSHTKGQQLGTCFHVQADLQDTHSLINVPTVVVGRTTSIKDFVMSRGPFQYWNGDSPI